MGSPPLLHETDYRVRFDEAGPDGRLRPSGYLRYAQDLAWRHSESAGFDRAWYRERGVHWLVHSLILEELAPVSYGEVLHATTEVTGWRRVWARRRSSFRRAGGRAVGAGAASVGAGAASVGAGAASLGAGAASLGAGAAVGDPAEQAEPRGDLVARMTIDWVLLDERGRPARVSEELTRYFTPGATFEPLRLRLPEAPRSAVRWRAQVRRADLDPMGHVNNAAYVDFLEEAFSARAAPEREAERPPQLPRTWHIEYLFPGLADQALTAELWRWGDGLAWRLRGDPAPGGTHGAGEGDTDGDAGRELCLAVVRPTVGPMCT